jgi:hypothetical protein
LISQLDAAETWRAAAPEGTLRFDVPPSGAGRRELQARLRELPAGTPVALFASGLGARRRSRRLAVGSGVELAREYLAIPSAAAPLYLVEDVPQTVRYFCSDLLVFPQRTPALVLAELLRGLASRAAWLAAGRLAVGRRA